MGEKVKRLLPLFLLLASAAHAQSFTLSLKSCATVPPSASTFNAQEDGSLVWWNLWNSAPWTGCAITVPTAGSYTVTGKASSPYTTSFHFAMAGANVGTLAVPATAGWGAYETVSAKLNLPAGAVILSFVRDALPANIYDLLTFTFNDPAPLQSVNLTLSGTLLWDDGTPIQGTVRVQEQNGTSPWVVLTTFTPDGAGKISGVVSISTTFADSPWFLFELRDAAGNVFGIVDQQAPGATFKLIHSVTDFKVVVNKASCAATQCVLAAGSNLGTLGP